ncbi:MAG: winged helix-turn-helix domain-containing protein [Clostridia bacterium]|nr:winged helix-turn-helix domain-containing protein [Clostridia bacterium]
MKNPRRAEGKTVPGAPGKPRLKQEGKDGLRKMRTKKGLRLVYDQNTACLLSPLEYSLYKWMKLHEGDVLSREVLLRDVWGYREMGDTRTVDMCVKRLRNKIGANRIESVYGKGYRMPA